MCNVVTTSSTNSKPSLRSEGGAVKRIPSSKMGKKKGRFKDFHARQAAWLKARRPMMEWLEGDTGEDTDGDVKEKLRISCARVFKEMDLDHSGGICFGELRQATVTMGLLLSDAEIEEMMHAADTNEDGTISGEEFYVMMHAEHQLWQQRTKVCVIL